MVLIFVQKKFANKNRNVDTMIVGIDYIWGLDDGTLCNYNIFDFMSFIIQTIVDILPVIIMKPFFGFIDLYPGV